MRVHVRQGDTEGLCASCKWLRVATFDNGERWIGCGAWGADGIKPIPRRVIECSQYDERGRMELWEMKQSAWLIDTVRKRVGFYAPNAMDPRRRTELLSEVDD